MPLMFAAFLAATQTPAAPPKIPNQMSAADVQKCGAIVADRNARIKAIEATDIDLKADADKLTARQTVLLEKAKTVNVKKKKDVEAYNAESAAFNVEMTAHHDKVTARNTANGEIPALIDAYNATCTHQPMNPKDVAALPEDQRLALMAGSKTTTIMVPAPPAPRKPYKPRP